MASCGQFILALSARKPVEPSSSTAFASIPIGPIPLLLNLPPLVNQSAALDNLLLSSSEDFPPLPHLSPPTGNEQLCSSGGVVELNHSPPSLPPNACFNLLSDVNLKSQQSPNLDPSGTTSPPPTTLLISNEPSWSSHFSKSSANGKPKYNLRFIAPVSRDFHKVGIYSLESVISEIKELQNSVVEFFMGPRPSFAFVKSALSKQWKING